MQTPLNASASSAGALLSNTTFVIPPFQREYSWGPDEVTDFWSDLSKNVESASYFLGLIILTDGADRKFVVDGQQRLITLTLLSAAIYYEAVRRGRNALADRIQADFLRAIDYDSDDTSPRVLLSDERDNDTFQHILDHGSIPQIDERDSVAARMADSFKILREKLKSDLAGDPFKRLSQWTKFLTDRLYFAVFVHPDSSSAYQVYEVINTRGKELTTADLLKNYVLSQTRPNARDERYKHWQSIQRRFVDEGTNNFVQYIRHTVTVEAGHVLPKDLFGFLAGRDETFGRPAPSVDELMSMLDESLALYLQMIDPTSDGPASGDQLKIFSAFNSLGIIAVRPLLLSMSRLPEALEGMQYLLRLVVRRIIVGNLGTGNVERRLGEAARKIAREHSWRSLLVDFRDLNPSREDFVSQLSKRSFNKGVLAFVRRSVLQSTTTPEQTGTLHFIWTRQATDWDDMSEEDGAFWGGTIGNTILAAVDRRPFGIETWTDFRESLLSSALDEEWSQYYHEIEEWDADAVETVGTELAQAAAEIWYGQ